MFVYALIDPRTDEIRYIGCTTRCPELRRYEHIAAIAEAVRGHVKTPKTRAKLSESLRGKPKSSEWVDKIYAKYQCADCAYVNTRQVLGRHVKKTGHSRAWKEV